MRKAWVGIDPGVSGAMALITDHGVAGVWDWAHELDMYNKLLDAKALYDIQLVVLEEVWGRKGNSSKSNTTFMMHYGAWKCILILAQVPWVEARPQEWMKRRIRAKWNTKDKPSIDYVLTHYPHICLEGPRGGLKDGRSDAVCIAEYAKERGCL